MIAGDLKLQTNPTDRRARRCTTEPFGVFRASRTVGRRPVKANVVEVGRKRR